jgi:MGT family glycosyltransferase
MRALFYSVKGSGHVNPTLPLVRALVERGHDVVYTLTREWKDRLESLGARYRNTGEGDSPFTTAAYHPNGLFMRQLLPAAAAVLPRLLAEARELQPDVIVYDSCAPWAPAIGAVLDCPAVCSVSTLVMSTGEIHELAGPHDTRVDAVNREALATLKERSGVDFSASDLGWFFAQDNLSYSCAELNPAVPSRRERFHFVGPLIAGGERTAELAASGLRARSALAGRRRVYVSMGTIAGEARNLGTAFFMPFVEAFAGRSDWEVVISVGKAIAPEAFGTLPDNVTVRQFVPQVALLPHVDVFVTHAGANSMHEALYCDVPMVCIPCFGDQHVNTQRVVAAGAGVPLAFDAVSAERVRSEVDRVAADASFRANAVRLGNTLRSCGGVDLAIQVLTDAARTPR